MKYKVKAFTSPEVIGQAMEVYLNAAAEQDWQLFEIVSLGSRCMVTILCRHNQTRRPLPKPQPDWFHQDND